MRSKVQAVLAPCQHRPVVERACGVSNARGAVATCEVAPTRGGCRRQRPSKPAVTNVYSLLQSRVREISEGDASLLHNVPFEILKITSVVRNRSHFAKQIRIQTSIIRINLAKCFITRTNSSNILLMNFQILLMNCHTI